MKAVVFHEHGDERVLQLKEFPEPRVGARDVLVRVKAVALNHLDIWVRQGWPGLKLELPHILGSDIAGVVERVGPEVADLSPGTEVLVNPGLSCGSCARCLSGEDNLCPQYRIIGEHTHGGYVVEESRLKPVLDRTLPLADAALAHQLLQNRAHFGNVVLLPTPL